MSWAPILVLVVGAYTCKAFGVVVLGRLTSGRADATPGLLTEMAALIPAALFAALIAVQTVEREGGLVLDARVVGVGAAAVAVWRRAPFVVVVAVAMGVTAAIRWQT